MISLGSAEARDRVLVERRVNLADVVRFIEVKGATVRAGAVELTDNEHEAAERFGARFFLYRVYAEQSGADTYEVAVLRHPTASPAERIYTRWSYRFSADSGAEWYRLPVASPMPLPARDEHGDSAGTG